MNSLTLISCSVRKILFFLILTSSFSGVLAQDMVMLEGRVLNDSIETAYLHVINLTMQKGTITNRAGTFVIPVREQDTIYVSAVQFEHKKIVITPDIISRKYIEFYLSEEVSELEEVNISDLNLSGLLGQDFSGIKVDEPFDPEAAGLPVYKGPVITVEERRLYTATHSGAGIIPVDAVINAITGRTNRLKKHVKISNMERRVQNARNFIEDSIYVHQLNIPPTLIDDFAHYVYENNERALLLIKRQNALAVIELLQNKASAYRKHKALK